jgi:hypothetical protein
LSIPVSFPACPRLTRSLASSTDLSKTISIFRDESPPSVPSRRCSNEIMLMKVLEKTNEDVKYYCIFQKKLAIIVGKIISEIQIRAYRL